MIVSIVLSKKLHSIIEDISEEKIEQSESITLQVQDVAIDCTQIKPEKVIISSSLGEVDKIQRSLTDVLKKNFTWAVNQHEVLSLQDSELILFKDLDIKDLNKENFEEELHSISSSMDFWREYLANQGQPELSVLEERSYKV